MNHDHYMGLALLQAEQALAENEFPVGCVIVHRDRVVAESRRTSTSAGSMNEIDHAEILALRRFAATVPMGERQEAVLYATMEPCLRCFAAIMLSGIRHVVYAYEDAMGGGTSCPRDRLAPLYRTAEMGVTAGVRRKESLALFQRFFLLPENRYWKGSYLESYTLSTT